MAPSQSDNIFRRAAASKLSGDLASSTRAPFQGVADAAAQALDAEGETKEEKLERVDLDALRRVMMGLGGSPEDIGRIARISTPLDDNSSRDQKEKKRRQEREISAMLRKAIEDYLADLEERIAYYEHLKEIYAANMREAQARIEEYQTQDNTLQDENETIEDALKALEQGENLYNPDGSFKDPRLAALVRSKNIPWEGLTPEQRIEALREIQQDNQRQRGALQGNIEGAQQDFDDNKNKYDDAERRRQDLQNRFDRVSEAARNDDAAAVQAEMDKNLAPQFRVSKNSSDAGMQDHAQDLPESRSGVTVEAGLYQDNDGITVAARPTNSFNAVAAAEEEVEDPYAALEQTIATNNETEQELPKNTAQPVIPQMG